MEIFEKGLRLKLRFESAKGLLMMEDLYDLDLREKENSKSSQSCNLDLLAKQVNKKLKEESEESFVTKRSKNVAELELKLAILKHVIEVKIAEENLAKERKERKAELEMLRTLQANKKVAALESLSLEEIEKRMAELEA